MDKILNLSTFGDVIHRDGQDQMDREENGIHTEHPKMDGTEGKYAYVFKMILQNVAQTKLLHWQSHFYGQHKALDDLFDGLIDKGDELAESVMGKYGRPSTKGQKFEMFDFEDVDIEDWTNGVCDLLISFSDVLDDSQDTDLLNVRDEMLGEFNKLKYLLTLNENVKKKKVIKLTENDLYRIVKRVINEQASDVNRKKAIQCFLSKKGLTS